MQINSSFAWAYILLCLIFCTVLLNSAIGQKRQTRNISSQELLFCLDMKAHLIKLKSLHNVKTVVDVLAREYKVLKAKTGPNHYVRLKLQKPYAYITNPYFEDYIIWHQR